MIEIGSQRLNALAGPINIGQTASETSSISYDDTLLPAGVIWRLK